MILKLNLYTGEKLFPCSSLRKIMQSCEPHSMLDYFYLGAVYFSLSLYFRQSVIIPLPCISCSFLRHILCSTQSTSPTNTQDTISFIYQLLPQPPLLEPPPNSELPPSELLLHPSVVSDSDLAGLVLINSSSRTKSPS